MPNTTFRLILTCVLTLAQPLVARAHGQFAMADVLRECGASAEQIEYVRAREPNHPPTQWMTVCRNLKTIGVDAINVLLTAPNLLNESNSFTPVFNGLTSLGFSNPRAMILKNPQLLIYPTATLRSKVRILLDAGVLGAVGMIERDSSILDQITEKHVGHVLKALDRLNFTRSDELLAARPNLLVTDLYGLLGDQIRMLRTEGLLRAEDAIQTTPELLDISREGVRLLITKLKRLGFTNPLNLVHRAPVVLNYLLHRNLDERIGKLNALNFAIGVIEDKPILLDYALLSLDAAALTKKLESSSKLPLGASADDATASPTGVARACGLTEDEYAALLPRTPKSADPAAWITLCLNLKRVNLDPKIILTAMPGLVGHTQSFGATMVDLAKLGFTDTVRQVHARPSLLVNSQLQTTLADLKRNRILDPNGVIVRAPLDLTPLDYANVKRVIDVLRTNGVPNPRRIVNAYPAIAGLDVAVKLPALLKFLTERGFAKSVDAFTAAPFIVGISTSTLGLLLDRLMTVGLRDPVAVVERVPEVWSYVADQSLSSRLDRLRTAGVESPGELIGLYPDVLRDPAQYSVASYVHLLTNWGLDHATIAREFSFPLGSQFLKSARDKISIYRRRGVDPRTRPLSERLATLSSFNRSATVGPTAETSGEAGVASSPLAYLIDVWNLSPTYLKSESTDALQAYAVRGRAHHARIVAAGFDPRRLSVAERLATVRVSSDRDVDQIITRLNGLHRAGLSDPQGAERSTPALGSERPPTLDHVARERWSTAWGFDPASPTHPHDSFFGRAFERLSENADDLRAMGLDPRRLPARFKWWAATRLTVKQIWSPLKTAFPTEASRAWALGLLGFTNPAQVLERAPYLARRSLGELLVRADLLDELGVPTPVSALAADAALVNQPADVLTERARALRDLGFENVGRMIGLDPRIMAYDSAGNVVPTVRALRDGWGFTSEEIERRPDLIGVSLKRVNEIHAYLAANDVQIRTLPPVMKWILLKRPMTVADIKQILVDAGFVSEVQQRAALHQHLFERGLFMKRSPCDDLLAEPWAMAAE